MIYAITILSHKSPSPINRAAPHLDMAVEHLKTGVIGHEANGRPSEGKGSQRILERRVHVVQRLPALQIQPTRTKLRWRPGLWW
jgi:hypothetical protein